MRNAQYIWSDDKAFHFPAEFDYYQNGEAEKQMFLGCAIFHVKLDLDFVVPLMSFTLKEISSLLKQFDTFFIKFKTAVWQPLISSESGGLMGKCFTFTH